MCTECLGGNINDLFLLLNFIIQKTTFDLGEWSGAGEEECHECGNKL